MSFKLPDLPYDYRALEPSIDTMTMHVHHEKHHATYVTKLNDALSKMSSSSSSTDIFTILEKVASTSTPVRNNGGGHYNHSLFWKWMSPVGSSNVKPGKSLASVIDSQWGSFEAMQKEFTDAAVARFGSGWAWLGVKPEDGSLAITSTANQGILA